MSSTIKKTTLPPVDQSPIKTSTFGLSPPDALPDVNAGIRGKKHQHRNSWGGQPARAISESSPQISKPYVVS